MENRSDWAKEVERALASAKASSIRRKRRPRRRYEYIPALLSYFDVLGMRDLLTEADNDANKVASVLNLFREFSKPDEPSRKIWKWKFVNFSDLVVRVLPINTDANRQVRLGLVFHEIFDLCHLQVNLVNRGVLVRGALTLGFITFRDGLIFGPALARAYDIESRIAKYPRLVVDEVVVEGLKQIPALRAHSFKEEMEYLKGTLRRDSDGALFLDYLNWTQENVEDIAEHIDVIRTHKSLIEKQNSKLQDLDLRTIEARKRLEKNVWMKKLHNSHVRNFNAQYLYDATGIRKKALIIQ